MCVHTCARLRTASYYFDIVKRKTCQPHDVKNKYENREKGKKKPIEYMVDARATSKYFTIIIIIIRVLYARLF